MKFNVKAYALTVGIWSGVGLFLLTWWLIILEGASGDVTFIGRIYPGYNISPLGSFIGLAWGFVDGLIFCGIFAWLYNMLIDKKSQIIPQVIGVTDGIKSYDIIK
ncbi:MAG: bacteriophage holin [Nitrospinales bacterium]